MRYYLTVIVAVLAASIHLCLAIPFIHSTSLEDSKIASDNAPVLPSAPSLDSIAIHDDVSHDNGRLGGYGFDTIPRELPFAAIENTATIKRRRRDRGRINNREVAPSSAANTGVPAGSIKPDPTFWIRNVLAKASIIPDGASGNKSIKAAPTFWIRNILTKASVIPDAAPGNKSIKGQPTFWIRETDPAKADLTK